MNIVFIADFFADEVLGGGELNNEELIRLLIERGHTVSEIKSSRVSPVLLNHTKGCVFIVSNFVQLSEESKNALMTRKYVIYEHDHKYLRSRNPSLYENYLAPKKEIINYDFFKNAKAVFCQSKFHSDIVEKNLKTNNIINLGGNLWSNEALQLMKKYSQKPKSDKYSIMNSNIEHKNTYQSVIYCKHKQIPYELINPASHEEFLNNLSNNSKLVFFPKTPETLSRIVVEARMMNMGVVTNSKVGATSENWFDKKGEKLIDIMKNKKVEILEKVLGALSDG